MPWLPRIFIRNWAAASYSCGWFHTTTDLSSGGWIRVEADIFYDWLEFRWPDKSCDCLKFRRLDTNFCWFHHTADLSSNGWIGVAADSILWSTRVSATRYELQLIPSCDWLRVAVYSILRLATSCSLFYPAADLRSAGWIRLAADLCFNISSKFKDLYCKIHQFYSLFSSGWFQLPLVQALAATSRTLKKPEEAWRSLKKLQDCSCDWFELRHLWPIDYLQNFDPDINKHMIIALNISLLKLVS